MAERANSQVLRHAVSYTAATYAVQVITLALALVIKRLLGPVNVGIWTSLMLLQSYLQLAQLRITDAAQKEIAFRRGRGEEDVATELRDVMFSACLALAVLIGAVVVAAAALVPAARAPEYRLGLALVGALFPLTQALVCTTVMFRAHKRFELLSRTMLLVAVINAALQVPLTLLWGFPGFMLAYAGASIANLVYWRYLVADRGLASFRPRWHWPTLRRLLAVGIPMQAGGLATMLFRSLDQVMLVGTLGPAALGLYSIGLSVNNFVYGIPTAVSVVTFPNFQERYGRTGTRAALAELVVVPVQAMAFVVLPLAVGGAYLLLPPLVRHVLPQFADGIAAAQVLLIGTFALSLNHMPGQFLITVDRQGPGIAATAAATAVLAGGAWLALHNGLGILGVAAATAVAYAFSSAVLLVVALSMAGSPRSALVALGECAVALLWTWAAAHTAARTVAAAHPVWWRDFGAAALAVVAFAVMVSPLLVYFQRRTGLLGALLRRSR
jgi:O-antigen/teichoic acid export membrane protein